MDRGFYTSVSGMMCNDKKLADIANNIANVNTTGYKKDISIQNEFSSLMINKMDENINVGNMVNQVYIDEKHTLFSPGTISITGQPNDIAILENGFFKINLNGEYRYTRAGDFTKDVEGNLVTRDGGYVMDKDNNKININKTPDYINLIQVVDFEDKRTLSKTNKGYFVNNNGISQEKKIEGVLKQGALEVSNVDVAEELTDMIKVQRNFQFNQKALKAFDELIEKMTQF